jgi:DNA-binding IclR family transcriptional regulator
MLGTVTKAGRVLDLFTPAEPEWGVGEVAERLGIPKSSAHGLLATLCGIGLVRNVAGRYRLGWRIVELNRTLYKTTGLLNGTDTVLRQLAEQVGATVELAALRHHDVAVLDRVVGASMRANDNRVGHRATANSACGKVLLAHAGTRAIGRFVDEVTLVPQTSHSITEESKFRSELNAVRLRGLAYDMEESSSGLCSVAAPIRDAEGTVHLAIGLTLPALSFRRDRELLGKSVQRSAARISHSVRSADGRCAVAVSERQQHFDTSAASALGS